MASPFLLTPGPLTTSAATKNAMLTDWGSWDTAFNALTAEVCASITAIAHAEATHVCVPLQGSGTFAVEAALGTLVPKTGKVLVPVNGAYCQRMVRILGYLGRACVTLDIPEDRPASAAQIEAALAADPAITHVAQVHCETGTGILNPLADIALAVARQGRRLIVDAMSTFGALDIDARTLPFDAVIAASGKCLEGVPGMGFAIVRRTALEASVGNSHSLALDLHDQWAYLQKTGQWRFTPPTHVVAALHAAIGQFTTEGGVAARGARYIRNCRALTTGMDALGFTRFLADDVQAPIIVTFHAPGDPHYRFPEFYARVRDLGYVLYPGKLTVVDTFRVGCIGALGETELRGAVAAIAQALGAMNVRQMAPASRAAA
jgi:2-aminoethylphosphonate-pyruvate transaminase